jgi:hypothetical protein
VARALPRQLAEAHGNPWQYRRLDTLAVTVLDSKSCAPQPVAVAPWLDGSDQGEAKRLGTQATTAQVTPVRVPARRLLSGAQVP